MGGKQRPLRAVKGRSESCQDMAGVGLTGLCVLLPTQNKSPPFWLFPSWKACHSLAICPSRRLSTLGHPFIQTTKGSKEAY